MSIATRMFAVACALVLGVAVLPADDKAKPAADDTPFTDSEFVAKAASCMMHQIELGRIAQQNAENADVKKFGERLVTDHTKAQKQLQDVAKAASIEVPAKMNEDDQKEVDRFGKLRGGEFDKAFVRHEVKDHEKGVAMLTRASKEAKDAGIKDFASKSLPTAKEHLEEARKLDKTLGGQ